MLMHRENFHNQISQMVLVIASKTISKKNLPHLISSNTMFLSVYVCYSISLSTLQKQTHEIFENRMNSSQKIFKAIMRAKFYLYESSPHPDDRGRILNVTIMLLFLTQFSTISQGTTTILISKVCET